MNNDIQTILYSQDDINQRLNQLANTITEKYRDQFPVIVSVMTGAMVFATDMIKRMNFKLNVDYVDVSSYENGDQSTGQVKLVQDLSHSIKGRPVIIMEDIIDTGYTLQYLTNLLADRDAKSIEICALLDKPARRQVNVEADYIGFTVPDEFIVGYGLDYDGLYRNLPFVGILKRSVYEN